MSYILRSTKFVRYFFGLARSIVVSNRPEIDGSLQRNHNLATLFSKQYLSSQSGVKYNSQLEQTVRQLDEDARRTGRVAFSEVEEALNNIRNSRQASASQSLMVIRCCGNLVPEESPEQRTKLVEEIWKTFQTLGVPLDISHYNALLKVYLENEHKFSPTEFLGRLEANGIEPNRVTYQRLIAGFCQQGDINGATKILEFMKEKQLPVNEAVFNALILGHSKAGDMESAEGILSVMGQANLEPSNETYMTLMCGYAAHGDGEAVQRLLMDCKMKDILLSDRDLLEIVVEAATNGHDQLVDEILKNIRRSMGYNQDAANVIIRLVTSGKDEAAYKVFQTLSSSARVDNGPNMSGHLFVKQLVKSNRPVDQILLWCERLAEDGHTPLGLWIAIDSSFSHNNTKLTLDLLRVLKQKQEPIRTHYFWPSLVTAGKAQNFNEVLEILRLMLKEFDVPVNSETIKDYILPHISASKNINEVLTSLDGVGVKRGQAVVASVNYLINTRKVKQAADLAQQNPNFNYNSHLFINQLLDVLQSTNDVASVVSLLHVLSHSRSQTMSSSAKEERDEEEESGAEEDVVHFFLLTLLRSSSTQKYLPDVLKEMLRRGLALSSAGAETIQNKLPENLLSAEVSELLANLSSGEVKPQPFQRAPGGPTFVQTPESMLKLIERLKARNEPEEKIKAVTRSLYTMYCHEGDVDGALRTKQALNEELKEETTPGMWALLLDAYCVKNDLEGAKSCIKNLEKSLETFELDTQKILKFAKLCVQNEQMDEAVKFLNMVKPRENQEGGNPFITRGLAWQLLLATADTYKDPEVVKQMLKLLVERKFVEVSNAILGPVIKAHLLSDDLAGALKEFEECVRLHRATPYKNELTIKFIEKEDATNLQTVVDLSTEVHGEVNSLYDLVLSFIECGKIRQARKILETPGLTNRNNRLLLACERYKNDGKVEHLEGLVEATKDVPYIDRSEIYNNLLDTYCNAGEPEKALGLWTKSQDEDVQVSDQFLIKLGNLLKDNGIEVPFKIPTPTPTETAIATTSPARKERTSTNDSSLLLAAIKNKNADSALKIKQKIDKEGTKLSRSSVSQLMELLVQQSRLKDATELLTSLKADQMPMLQTLKFLVIRLASSGEIDLLRKVEQNLSDELKKLMSISNRIMVAAVNNGNVKEELDKLEKQIDEASSSDDIDVVSEKFPRGGIMAVLENSPASYDQVVSIVDKFYNKGSSGPANCLVMHFLGTGDLEKASQLFEKYNLKNSSSLMFRNILTKARINKNPKLLEDLLGLVKDVPSMTSGALAIIYSNLINVHADLKDYDTALQKLEEGLKKIPLDSFYTSSLVKLKEGLESSNKTFKYNIPPKKQKDSSSSSSSSSETEPKKSFASN